MKKGFIALSMASAILLADSFTLGEIKVQDNKEDINMFESSITSDDIKTHSSDTITDALNNISGLSSDAIGARAETTMHIRGFDAKRISVFLDGVPIYIPYDGNFDYDRFLSSNISSIDVSKGYSSLAYGSNAMAGVINIVSKRPTKELEGDIKGKIVFDSNGEFAKHIESLRVGTFQNGFYAQLGAAYSKRDHFRLSDDYKATADQPTGDRLRSQNRDQKIDLKTGYIANDGSEIALSYVNQKGKKEEPPSTDTTYTKQRFWDWPYWDKETISLSGVKNFDNSYIKSVLYYDKSKNSLFTYKNNTYTLLDGNPSRYDDYSYGARFEYGVELQNNFLKAIASYKKDVHRGYDINKTTFAETMNENYEDHTISLAIEDTYSITRDLDILAGVGYEKQKSDKIFDTNTAYSYMMKQNDKHSLSPQAALVYALNDFSKLRFSVSQKTYLPSMKDRYSRKMGKAAPNPSLKNEKATHYELSYQLAKDGFSTTATAFYSRIKDYIQSVVYEPSPALFQNQNIGKATHKGIELDAKYKQDSYTLGANYIYLDVDMKQDNLKVIGSPKHQAFLYAQKDIIKNLAIYANAKLRDGSYAQKMDSTYHKVPSFTTYDLKLIYNYDDKLSAEAGVKNITDKLYYYDMAYPEAGREFFVSLGYKF